MARYYSRARPPIEEPTVNLTPLIDVVFVILIMFIVVAPILELDRIELAEASGNPENPINVTDASPIAVHVKGDNTIYFGQQRVSIAQLVPLLQTAHRQYPSARPQLFHDKKGHFGTYQGVKNAFEAAGFRELDIVLQP